MKSNSLEIGERCRGLLGEFGDRPGQAVEVAADEGVLDQASQSVVVGRIGRAERRPGSTGQFGHHVAVRRRERLPVVRAPPPTSS